MKIALVEIILIGNSMRRIEAAGLKLAAADQVRWAVARKRLAEFIDPHIENVRTEFAKGSEQTEQAWVAVERQVLSQINGEQFDVRLPDPIKLDAIKDLSCQSPGDYDALAILVGPIFAEAPQPASQEATQ